MNFKDLKEGDIVGVATYGLSEAVILTVLKCTNCGELYIAPLQEGNPFNLINRVYFIEKKFCLQCHSNKALSAEVSNPNPN